MTTTTISVYASTELRNFAQQQASKEGRSVSNYIVRLLEREREAVQADPKATRPLPELAQKAS